MTATNGRALERQANKRLNEENQKLSLQLNESQKKLMLADSEVEAAKKLLWCCIRHIGGVVRIPDITMMMGENLKNIIESSYSEKERVTIMSAIIEGEKNFKVLV